MTKVSEAEQAAREVMRLIQEALTVAPKAGLHLAIKVTAVKVPTPPAEQEIGK